MPTPRGLCILRAMAADDILLEMEEKMMKSVEVVSDEFAKIRTGRAAPALVENLAVECYGGTTMRLKELAGITTPEARMIVIQPWDASVVNEVAKAIQKSELGLTPRIDGKIIRLAIPDLSEERRKDLAKIVKKMAEDGRVAVRHVRREAMDGLKAEQKGGKISEDDLKVHEKEVQAKTDEYIGEIEKLLAHKEKELVAI